MSVQDHGLDTVLNQFHATQGGEGSFSPVKRNRAMELTLTLTFACCCCHNAISATLHCKGGGLTEPAEECVAAVNVVCPGCERVCQLLFDPLQKSVRDVRLYVPAQPIPEPSVN
jgi:hypothetical protein